MLLIKQRSAKADPGLPLHVKLRPITLDQVVGQPAVVKSLQALFASDRLPHAFLLTGGSGFGKTTIARILASMVGCKKDAIFEVDAARFSSVDAVRELIVGAQFVAMSANSRKFFIIDECHSLSKQAFQSLLLSIEEPPPHVWWALATTEPDKIPQTIRTRCHAYDLKPVKWDEIAEFLEGVIESERIKIADGVLEILSRRAMGSLRQALVMLSTVAGITDKAEALRLLETAEGEDAEAVQLARIITSGRGFTWDAARALLAKMADTPSESIRLVVVNYATVVLMQEKSEKQAERLLAVLQAFGTPCNTSERQAPLLLAIGSLLFGS